MIPATIEWVGQVRRMRKHGHTHASHQMAACMWGNGLDVHLVRTAAPNVVHFNGYEMC